MNASKVFGAFMRLSAQITGLKRQLAASGNYTANKETRPTKVRFANGRVIEVVGDGFLKIGREPPSYEDDI